jgi:predicted Rdx family selenoprotein
MESIMGLFTSWFRAKWQHPDADVRLAAVRGMGAGDDVRLAGIALRDTDARVRAVAAGLIGDADQLTALVAQGDDAVRRIARERLSGIADQALRGGTWAKAGRFLDRVADTSSLTDLALRAADAEVRRQAFARLLALDAPGAHETMAMQDEGGELGVQVLTKLARRQVKHVAKKAKHARVRAAATALLAQRDAEDAAPSEAARLARLRSELAPLADRALRIAVTSDLDRAAVDLAQVEAAVAALTNDGAPTDDAIAQTLARIHRAAAEFRQRAAAAASARAEADAARAAILAEARAGVADADTARALQARLAAVAGGDAAGAGATLDALLAPVLAPTTSAAASRAPEPLSAETVAQLDALATQATALISGEDHRDARWRFQLLHKQLDTLGRGAVASHPDFVAARDRFTQAFLAFKERGRAERAARDERRGAQVAAAEALIAEVSAPVPADTEPRTRVEELKRIGVAFRSALAGLRSDQAGPLRERMRPLLDAAWAPLKSFQEAEDWERFQHLAKADEIIAGVEALAAVEDPALVLRGLKEAQAAWKRTGPLPRAKAATTWERFKAVQDAQYTRLKPWFAEQDTVRQEHLAAKQAVLTDAEALAAGAGKAVGLPGSPADVQARQQAVQRMKELQERWKQIGPVPREHDDAIWGRWRAAGDTFWKAHKADLAARDQSHTTNLAAKESLIVQAVTLAETAERAKAAGLMTSVDIIRRIKDLMSGWKDIGHVPRDQVETQWRRWREALDRCWATVKDHTDAIAAERAANKAKKEALIAEAVAIAGTDNARWFKEDVRALQRQWRDIGPVDRADADDLELRFRTSCGKVLSLGDAPPA